MGEIAEAGIDVFLVALILPGFLFFELTLCTARAWRIKVGSAADQGLFAIFFFVLTGAIALVVVSARSSAAQAWLVVLPVWLIGSTVFWLWVPRFLLHRKIVCAPCYPARCSPPSSSAGQPRPCRSSSLLR